MSQDGDKPTGRSGYTITKLLTKKNQFVMFGGLSFDNEKDTAKPNNEVFVLQIKGQKGVWAKVECKGDYPLPRTYHSACAVGN